MNKKIVQLGYGKMGKAVVDDLRKTAQFDELVVADVRPDLLADIAKIEDPRVKPVRLDVDDQSALLSLMEGADVVVDLLPIRYTMQVAQAAVKSDTHMVSSVFIIDWSIQDREGARRQQEQMAEVDRRAREKELTILKEFGMDPGLDLIMAGETVRQLDEVQVLYTYGAGFPERKLSTSNPIAYKFTWSIIDTILSYSIPGRMIKNGKVQEVPADSMFDPANYHILDLDEIGGPLECFVNGDGDKTTQALQIAFEERLGSRSVLSMKINPVYDFLRDDPRFIALLARVGLSYQ